MIKPILKKLVVIGNGMAGARVVEEILLRAPGRFEIVMFGAEPYGNYNRILLSNVLNGSQQATDIFINPLSWYQENGVRLHAGVKVSHIDRKRRIAVGVPLKRDSLAYSVNAESDDGAAVIEEPYDHVIIATGSRPFVPPMEGFGAEGTFLFRTIDDCSRIADFARNCQRATVIGGGLLGLEAARGQVIASSDDGGRKVTVICHYDTGYYSGTEKSAAVATFNVSVKLPAGSYRLVRSDADWTDRKVGDAGEPIQGTAAAAANLKPSSAAALTWVRQ